jgi:hypothetical protein
MKSARVVFRVARGVEVRVSQGICRLFGSCPLRCKTLVFPGFFAFLANCVSYLLSTFYALLTDGPW